jgi:hypothetical protein
VTSLHRTNNAAGNTSPICDSPFMPNWPTIGRALNLQILRKSAPDPCEQLHIANIPTDICLYRPFDRSIHCIRSIEHSKALPHCAIGTRYQTVTKQ